MSPVASDIRLLMVDDEREFLEAVAPALSRRGFDVTLAEDGKVALELLSARTFDVVVLDVKMPGIDGVEVFRHIKRGIPELPVVLLTGHGTIAQAFDTSREGVQDYLAKPCDVETLAKALRDAVEKAARRGTAAAAAGDEIRLLLVDDDVDFVRSVTPALERRGVVVSAAGDAAQALELLRIRRFQVAVVDVVLPGMDGLSLLDRMRERDPLIEVIILTGNPLVGDVRRGLRQGAFDYLVKPCAVEELTGVIRAARDRRNSTEEEARRSIAEAAVSARPD